MLTNNTLSDIIFIADGKTAIEAWLSLVERCVRDAEVVGSNPVASTEMKMPKALTIKSFGIFSYVRKRPGEQEKISGHEFSHEFFRPIGKEYTRRKFL